jgi:putative spermidine/putrescine transport system ATP-binding protein
MDTTGAYLSLHGLAKRYGDGPPAVPGVDLAAAQGEFLTLLGPSGCGKTTVLRMIAGLVEPSAGRIFVDGADITEQPTHKRNMGLVFQNYALFPHLTIARNVAFGLDMRAIDAAASKKLVADGLALVRLAGLERRMPKQLSGGQQQRVALARALVIEPAVLLLDEPLSNLDAKLREELRDEIRDIQRRLGITTVFVTHDQAEALTMSDRVAVMNAGRVEQVGTPSDIYENPASAFVATFIGRMNRITSRVAESGPGGSVLIGAGVRLSTPRMLPQGSEATAMIRPHRIRLVRPATAADGSINRLQGRVRKAVFAGETVQYEIEAAGTTLSVECPTRSAGLPFAPDDDVEAEWDPADTMAFAAP